MPTEIKVQIKRQRQRARAEISKVINIELIEQQVVELGL